MTTVSYSVELVESAEADLYEIHRYVELHDSAESADILLDDIERVIKRLGKMPQRGHFPPELERIGVKQYRETHHKPYRILYEIHEAGVIVHCVLDGRRDMQTLLQQRLLR
jgi:toxin ParE1/3/4